MPRILLVDDDPALLSALPEAMLRRMPGVVIETADSAEKALSSLRQDQFDLVISDLVMSDSVRLMAALEEIKPATPTIVITGVPETAAQRYPTMAAGVLPKPFDVCTLAALAYGVLKEKDSHTL